MVGSVPVSDRNELATVNCCVQDLMDTIHRDLQVGLVQCLGANEYLANEIATMLHAHLAGLGQPDVDDFTIPVRPDTSQQEIAFILKGRVLPAK